MLDQDRQTGYDGSLPDKRETSGLRSDHPTPSAVLAHARFAAMTHPPFRAPLAEAALQCLHAALNDDWEAELFGALAGLLATARSDVDLRGTPLSSAVMAASDKLSLQLSAGGLHCDGEILFGLGAAGALLEYRGDELHDERMACAEIAYCTLGIALRRRRLAASGHRLAATVHARKLIAAGSATSLLVH